MPLKKTVIKPKAKNINNVKKSLLIIRKKIDNIDSRVHDLLMKRAEFVNDVIKVKRKENIKDLTIYRPAREHEILLRLIKRHKGSMPIKSLVSIWRKLISTYISIQGELKISFSDRIDDIVNDYFSADIKKIKTKSSISSLKNLYENKCNITILPFPSKKNNWWHKLSNFSGIKVVGSLSDSLNGDIVALVLSKQDIEYAGINTALYTTKINSKSVKLYSNFLTSKGFTVICKKLITSKKSIILFSIQVTSEIEQRLKITSIKNFQLDKNVNPEFIGVFSTIDKEIINA